MPNPRRDFMKSLGISLGSILISGCVQSDGPDDLFVFPQRSTKSQPSEGLTVSETETVQPDPTSTTFSQGKTIVPSAASSTADPPNKEIYPFNDPNLPPRARLRHCWFYLSWLARCYAENDAKGKWAEDLLRMSHRAALVELIAAGKMSETIARDIQSGFDSAINHVHSSAIPMTCYD